MEYTWKQYYANISISGIDKLKNSGDSQIVDFVKSKVKNAEKTMAQQLGDGLWSNGTDTKALVGLRVANSASNTVGGISQTDYSWWRPQRDATTTTMTMLALQAQFNAATIDNDMPTVALTTRTLYNSYWNLLQPQQRFTDSETAKGGFTNLMFNSIPVIVDSKSPSSYFSFLNEKYIMLFAHKDCDMKFVPFQKPINQDVESAKVLWAGALGYSNLRMLAFLSALTS